jgi:hypothetical protein
MEELNNFPEHKKLLKSKTIQKHISNFLKFLQENGLSLCELDKTSNMFFRTYQNNDQILSSFLGIDYEKFMKEKEELYKNVSDEETE